MPWRPRAWWRQALPLPPAGADIPIVILAFVACSLYPEPVDVPAWPRIGDRVDVELSARVGDPGEAVAWTASVREGLPTAPVAPGCARVVPVEAADPGFERVAVDVPAAANLAWQAERGAWRAEGPRAAVDPAWAVGRVLWVKDGTANLADGAIRFAGAPELRGMARDEDGSVRMWWAPSEDRVVVRASMAGQDWDCRGDESGVRVPWWLVPAAGGAVVLRVERDHLTIVPDRGVVHVRAALEKVVPLDVPLTTRDEAPPDPTPRERPKRLWRLVPTIG